MERSKQSDPKTYTKPELRDGIKKRVLAKDKGGKPGKWSARKAQLATQEYEQEGGGYKRPPNQQQKSLQKWGTEHATTEGKKSRTKGRKQTGPVTKRKKPAKKASKRSSR